MGKRIKFVTFSYTTAAESQIKFRVNPALVSTVIDRPKIIEIHMNSGQVIDLPKYNLTDPTRQIIVNDLDAVCSALEAASDMDSNTTE